MGSDEAGNAFSAELEKLINYFRKEFDLTYSQAIGILFMTAYDLCSEAADDDED